MAERFHHGETEPNVGVPELIHQPEVKAETSHSSEERVKETEHAPIPQAAQEELKTSKPTTTPDSPSHRSVSFDRIPAPGDELGIQDEMGAVFERTSQDNE